MNNLPDLYTIGFFVMIFGAILIVLNLFSNVTGTDTVLKIVGVEISGAKSTVVFLVGISLMTYHASLTMPKDNPVDLPKGVTAPPIGNTITAPSPSTDEAPPVAPSTDAPKNNTNDASKESLSRQATTDDDVYGWSYFGSMTNGVWNEKNFSGGTGLAGMPRRGDRITALTDVSLRTGPIQLTISGWKNQPRIGIIKNGESIIIKDIEVIRERFYWFSVKEIQ